MNDADFRQSEKDWHAFVDKVTEKLVEIDDTVPELPVKDVVSRDTNTHVSQCKQLTFDRSFEFIATSGSVRTRRRTR